MTHLEGFVKFVKDQPPDKTYNSLDPETCALAQYAKSVDPEFVAAMFTYWQSGNDVIRLLPKEHRYDYRITNVIMHSRTFGELAGLLDWIELDTTGTS